MFNILRHAFIYMVLSGSMFWIGAFLSAIYEHFVEGKLVEEEVPHDEEKRIASGAPANGSESHYDPIEEHSSIPEYSTRAEPPR